MLSRTKCEPPALKIINKLKNKLGNPIRVCLPTEVLDIFSN